MARKRELEGWGKGTLAAEFSFRELPCREPWGKRGELRGVNKIHTIKSWVGGRTVKI